VLAEALAALDIGRFRIKLNHRRLLDAMMRTCGVPAAKFRPICSAIDKLDKEPWAAVRAEMVDQKGLAPEARPRAAVIRRRVGFRQRRTRAPPQPRGVRVRVALTSWTRSRGRPCAPRWSTRRGWRPRRARAPL